MLYGFVPCACICVLNIRFVFLFKSMYTFVDKEYNLQIIIQYEFEH